MKHIYYFSVFFLTFGCHLTHESEPGTANLPNIILCMADDQGWGDMGYNGHSVIKTPHFDSMAREVFRFDHFYAAAPVCSPTRGSVLTGRHPNRFACFTWGRTLRPQEITLAEVLQNEGYVTGHFGKWHLGSVRQGSPVNPGNSGFEEWFSAPNFFDNDPILSRKGIAEQTYGESSMVTMDAALSFIEEQAGKEAPYLAVIWFGSPHGPHLAAEEDLALYGDQSEHPAHFYGEITGMDRALGKLRSRLKNLADYENTILWYCSDNGGLPGVGATGGRGHKGQIYEGGLRVPALLQWPALIEEPFMSNLPANTFDIYSTVLDMAGVSAGHDHPLDGISLLPFIKNRTGIRPQPMPFWDLPAPGIRTPSAEWMPELLEAQVRGNMVGDSSRLRLDAAKIAFFPVDSLPGHAAWLDWPWKLHRIKQEGIQVKYELYNLEMDSMEANNLLESEVLRIPAMKSDLEKWQQSVIRSLNGGDY